MWGGGVETVWACAVARRHEPKKHSSVWPYTGPSRQRFAAYAVFYVIALHAVDIRVTVRIHLSPCCVCVDICYMQAIILPLFFFFAMCLYCRDFAMTNMYAGERQDVHGRRCRETEATERSKAMQLRFSVLRPGSHQFLRQEVCLDGRADASVRADEEDCHDARAIAAGEAVAGAR